MTSEPRNRRDFLQTSAAGVAAMQLAGNWFGDRR